MQPVVTTDRLLARPFASADARPMQAVLCDGEVMRFSLVGRIPPGAVRDWIAREVAAYRHRPGLGRWAVAERGTGAVLGYAGLTTRDGLGEIEIGYRLARHAWGRGVATEIAAALLRHGHGALGLRRIIGVVDPLNAGSVRVIEKIGMVREGEVVLPGYDRPDHLYASSAAER